MWFLSHSPSSFRLPVSLIGAVPDSILPPATIIVLASSADDQSVELALSEKLRTNPTRLVPAWGTEIRERDRAERPGAVIDVVIDPLRATVGQVRALRGNQERSVAIDT